MSPRMPERLRVQPGSSPPDDVRPPPPARKTRTAYFIAISAKSTGWTLRGQGVVGVHHHPRGRRPTSTHGENCHEARDEDHPPPVSSIGLIKWRQDLRTMSGGSMSRALSDMRIAAGSGRHSRLSEIQPASPARPAGDRLEQAKAAARCRCFEAPAPSVPAKAVVRLNSVSTITQPVQEPRKLAA